MIAYICGTIEEIESDRVVIDNNKIGYNVFATKQLISSVKVGEEVKLHTYFCVREDSMQLFGFSTREELYMFRMLLGVGGVGPKVAMSILSAFPGTDLAMAIMSDDETSIARAQGIGKKTAQRIIIELKDKLDINEIIGMTDNSDSIAADNGIKKDAILALVSLGYSNASAVSAVSRIDIDDNMDTADVIKAAFKYIV